MSDSENYFEEIVDLLNLRSKGINIDYFEHAEKNKLAGHYGTFSNILSINRELVHFWSATFTTVLHEFKHFQQRRAIGSTLTFLIVVFILGYLFSNTLLFPTNLISIVIYGVILVVFEVMIQQFYFERGARDRSFADNVLMVEQVTGNQLDRRGISLYLHRYSFMYQKEGK